MTTTWEILDTKSQIANGVVTKVIYGCTVKSENNMDRKMGEITLTGNTTDPNFVPFENLTKETVIGWVKTSLGETEVTSIETELQNRLIDRQAAIDSLTEKSGLPWRL